MYPWYAPVGRSITICAPSAGENVAASCGQTNHHRRMRKDHEKRCASFDSHSQIHVKLVNP